MSGADADEQATPSLLSLPDDVLTQVLGLLTLEER